MKRSRCGFRISLAAFISGLLVMVSADAATLTVTSSADAGGTCPGTTCTLRQAIATAASDDTINFSLPSGTTAITLTSAELLINKNVTISGPGANLLRVQRSAASGIPAFGIFDIESSSSVSISGLTIANGSNQFGGSGIRSISGGTLTIANCTISGNFTSNSGTSGGGIWSDGPMTITNSTISGNSSQQGGGIANGVSGVVTITNSTISGNSSLSGGGIGNYGTLIITNCTVSGNTATRALSGTGNGGGILNYGTVNAKNSIIAKNTGVDGPDFKGTFNSQGYNLIGNTSGTTITGTTTGNQLNVDPMLGPLQDNGGPTFTQALLSGTTAIDAGNSSGSATDQRGFIRPVDSPVIGNATGGDGSDIGAYEVQADQLPGCGNPVVTNNNDSGAGSLRSVVANACAGATITFASSVVSPINLTSGELSVDKQLTIDGPGANLLTVQRDPSASSNFNIFTVTASGATNISGLTISKGNPNYSGGGISVGSSGSTGNTLTITDCVVAGNAANTSGALPSNGGGIFVGSLGAPALVIRRSTISGNSATQDGGGISAGSLTITNSTISGNSAARYGGGVSEGGTTTIVNSTIANNTGATGGGVRGGGYSVTARNTIFAKNTATTADPDFSGAVTSQGFNFIGNNSGATITPAQFSDQIGTAASPKDPMLGPLQDNGGPTLTQALLTGSTAIDKGNSSGSTTDQRGFPRPVGIANVSGGDGSDIGAFELQPVLSIIIDDVSVTEGNSGTTSAVFTVSLSGASAQSVTVDYATADGTATTTDSDYQAASGTLTFNPGDTSKTITVSVNGDTVFEPDETFFVNLSNAVNAEIAKGQGTGTILNDDPAPTPSPIATPTTLGNISTRLRVETGDNVLIGGFIITGTQGKKVILRAIGPSLPVADALADPFLELHDGSGALLEANDNWVDSPEKQAIIDSTIPPSNDLESAIVATLPANSSAYTAIVRGVNDTTGVGLVEVYDLDTSVDSKLANISTRGLVQTGDNVMIGGFIVLGQSSQKIIARAIGPSLPVPGALADPTLELHNGNGDVIAFNDNWKDSQQAEIEATTIPPSNDLESAIVATLTPGNYTAIVRGKNDTTGVALVEVYGLN
jgi:Calx-beta domain